MTVIFQLFSAADLQNLSPGQLKELRDLVRDELETSDQVREALRERAQECFSSLRRSLLRILSHHLHPQIRCSRFLSNSSEHMNLPD